MQMPELRTSISKYVTPPQSECHRRPRQELEDPCLLLFSAPTPYRFRFAIIFSFAFAFAFAFPEFHTLCYDPMMTAGFILSIITIIVVLLGLVMRSYCDAFIPVERPFEGTEPTVACETKGELAGKPIAEMNSSEHGEAVVVKYSTSEQEVDDKHIKESVAR
jgi:solute carrier family 6 GABA transporter-like protein 1